MDKSKYIYISDQITQTVIDSQVINWLEVMSKNGYIFDLFIVTPISFIFSDYKFWQKKLESSKNKLSGKIRTFYALRVINKSKFSSITFLVFLFIHLFPAYVIRKQKIVIQTRKGVIVNVLNKLKFIYKKINIIYDYRGAHAEEFINKLKFKSIEEIKDERIIRQYIDLLNTEIRMLKISDFVFSVSEELKKYILSKLDNPEMHKEKIIVVPGAADEEIFKFDLSIREKTREQYNLIDKIVLIYTGKLNAFWHKKEDIFSFISILLKNDDKFFFLCITPDKNIAINLLSKYKINENQALVEFSEFEKVSKYLNASDFGIILRDDIMTNKVASPTKIPEYLLTGLPVIISPNIGDYSDFIFRNNMGIITTPNEDIQALKHTIKNWVFDRNIISKKSSMHYSKQRIAKRVIDIYKLLEVQQ